MRIQIRCALKLGLLVFVATYSCITDKDAEIKFINGDHNFGTIGIQDTLFHTYLLKNSSKIDLKIMDFNSSCGCTTMQIIDSVIKPMDTAKIKVRFLPDKLGPAEKFIIVEANTNPPFSVLKLKGEVKNP